MCQNPSGRILKNPAKYGFEIADAISKPIGYETCKGSMFHNPASPDRFLKKPAKYEFETLDVFQILYVLTHIKEICVKTLRAGF